MKKVVLFALAALLVPSVAFAKGPPAGKGPGTHGKAPKVMYILKGTITDYMAASGATNGSITITVGRSNRHKWGLKDMSLVVPVSSATKIVLRHGATSPTINDRGVVKVKAPKSIGSSTDLVNYLAGTAPQPTAFQIIDQGVTGNSGSQGQGSGTHGKSAPKVMYILKGTITDYMAASGATNGSITITVGRSNRHKWGLKDMSLVVPVSSATKIVLRHGATSPTINDRGVVKVKAPKSIGSSTDLVNYLAGTAPQPTAFQIIDQGVAAP